MARPDRGAPPAAPETPVRPETEEGMVPLAPVVHQVFPFTEIARAHEAMEQNEPVGKIVLTW
jgi:threonine dehydrogenase-like Zn-dependent dehydrogenase